MKQLEFNKTGIPHRKNSLSYKLKKKKIYGGSILFKKFKRPLESNKPIHTVFRVNKKLALSLRKNTSKINQILLNHLQKFSIKSHSHSINSNHIHIVISTADSHNIGLFFRSFSGHLALFYKIKLGLKHNLWEGRPFTKVANWGQHFSFLKQYIHKNFKETVGFMEYSPRLNQYGFLNRFEYG